MSSFNASYKGIGALLISPEMVAEMRRRAEKVETLAVAIAPDAPPYGVGYIASFEVESGIRERKTRRAYAQVSNTSDHALEVEYGSKTNLRHRTLGKALDAAKD